MAKFLSVAPLHILKTIFESRPQYPKQCLLLAHDVVQYASGYSNLFKEQRFADSIIMDNSAYELKSAVDSEMVWEAVRIVKPTCVVLPDVYLDGVKTLEQTQAVHEDWMSRRRDTLRYLNSPQLMAIPQGKTFEEWVWCAEQLAKLEHIHWWGIPKNMQTHLQVSRQVGVQVCRALDRTKQIHLFGFSDDYVDDMVTAHMNGVASIDSTTPIRAGSLDIDFYVSSLAMDLGPRGDWWETAAWNDKIVKNLTYTDKVF